MHLSLSLSLYSCLKLYFLFSPSVLEFYTQVDAALAKEGVNRHGDAKKSTRASSSSKSTTLKQPSLVCSCGSKPSKSNNVPKNSMQCKNCGCAKAGRPCHWDGHSKSSRCKCTPELCRFVMGNHLYFCVSPSVHVGGGDSDVSIYMLTFMLLYWV